MAGPDTFDLDRLRLARTEGVGPVTYRRLMRRHGSAGAALDALPGIARAAGREPPARPAVEREMDATARLGGRFLFTGDPDFPPLLAGMEGAPAVVSLLGDAALLSQRAIGVVGARNASANGQRMAEALASDLGSAGFVVVSGLARGIDTSAHKGAMRTGRTVACIAGGLDVAYPPENAELQTAIAESGAVVTLSPLGTAPQARHFPRRNRVIAGLSMGVVVVEAAPNSGSLITARLAQSASRELFAVPGSPLDPRCRGSNDLIRSENAHLTESAADVTAALRDRLLVDMIAEGSAGGGGFAEDQAPMEDLDVLRFQLLGLLGPSPVVVDDLLRRCHFTPSSILGVLQELEAEGIAQMVGSHVSRVGE